MTESVTQTVRDQLLRTYTPDELSSWFNPLQVSEKEDSIVITFPHVFFEPWFKAKGKKALESVLKNIFGQKKVIQYECAPKDIFHGLTTGPTIKINKTENLFGSQFSFDTFLHNRKNVFPYQCAKNVAEQDKKNTHASFNPFVLWGESGTGKTHLARAMANVLQKRGRRIFFSLGAELKIQCAQAETAFIHNCLNADVLIVDGLDDLLTEHEFHDDILSIIDTFTAHDKQMIFTLQRMPEIEQRVSPRLFSRLEQGLAVELLKPDMDIRMQYVARRTSRQSIRLTKDQVLTMVQRFTGFRQIDGVLNRLESLLYQQGLLKKNTPAKINQKDFEELLQYSAGSIRQHLTSAAVIEATASHLSLSPADIIGDKRNQDISKARQIAMLLCRELLHCSYPELGRIFGGKDHSTAMYSIKKAKQLLQDNKDTRIAYTDILRRCKEQS